MSRYGSWSSARDFSKKTANEANTLKINVALLKDLLNIQAPSGKEEPVMQYIQDFIETNKINCTLQYDKNGNMFITKGVADHYPCIVAHMDEVCGESSSRIVIELNNVLIGINPNTGEHAGCPGDDRVGVYCALELLMVLDYCKICFFVEEEIGAGRGSQMAPLNFYNDCAFILQADRASDDEMIVCSNGGEICSEAFKSEISAVVSAYNYRFSDGGTFTDCGVLSSRGVGVSCINLGAAYFDNHSMDEKVCVTGVENVLNLMYRISTDFAYQKWPNTHTKYQRTYTYSKYGGGYSSGGYSSKGYSTYDDYDDYYTDWHDSKKTNEFAVEKYVPKKEKEVTDIRKAIDEFDFKYADAVSVASSQLEDEIPCLRCKTYDCMNCKFSVM